MNYQTTPTRFPRRNFLRISAVALSMPALISLSERRARAAEASGSLKGRIYKSLKIGMVQVPGSLTEKFKALKELGFDGVEMDIPGMDVEDRKSVV